ncbi:MAG: hypothetical protein AB7N65_06200 [Vicinamibacterales bacterium]
MSSRPAPRHRTSGGGTIATPGSATRRPPRAVAWLPLLFVTGLALVTLTPRVQSSVVVTRSIWAAVAGLLLWHVVLLASRRGRSTLSLTPASPRAQHYVQGCCQLAVYAYWGWYWPPVYQFVWLIVAQLLFAYAFDVLLSWTRRGTYALGFGPLPIILSTNLFLWFRDDWFYLQFVLIGVGVMGKELVRWDRDGRSSHVFNPSAFSLGLFSLLLILTGTTHLTWGPEIASTLGLGPHIYVVLFGVGLVVMYFFSVTLVTMSAAAVLFGLSALYFARTGVPYFVDSEIPSAVFLGLHLLVTDPSTSPRTPFGKLIFGVLYGGSVFGLYSLLGAVGVPTFYDKLLCVPVLNLLVPWIDRTTAAFSSSQLLRQVGLAPPLGRANVPHMAVWVLLFGSMTLVGGTDGRHTGDQLPFWQQACALGRPSACNRLLQIETSYCADNSGWACNEVGRHYVEGTIVARDVDAALGYYSRGCEVRFQPACVNLLDAGFTARSDPRALDLRLLLREGGPNLIAMPESELYARACDHGWTFACAPPAPVASR